MNASVRQREAALRAALVGEWMSKRGRRRSTLIRARENVIDLRGAGWPR